MLRAERLPLLGILVMGALIACEDDTNEPENPLNESETESLFLGMRALAADTAPTIVSVSPQGIVIACPLGGQVTAAGGGRDETVGDTARIVTDFTLTPAECGFGSRGLEFAVTGNPSVRDQMSISIVGFFEHFVVEGATTGTLDWELDGRTGTCEIDLELSAVPDLTGPQPTVNGGYSGTMCGLDVNFSVGSLLPEG